MSQALCPLVVDFAAEHQVAQVLSKPPPLRIIWSLGRYVLVLFTEGL